MNRAIITITKLFHLWSVLCARRFAKHYAYSCTFNLHNDPVKEVLLSPSISQRRKPRLREAKYLAQSHTAFKSQIQSGLTPMPMFLISCSSYTRKELVASGRLKAPGSDEEARSSQPNPSGTAGRGLLMGHRRSGGEEGHSSRFLRFTCSGPDSSIQKRVSSLWVTKRTGLRSEEGADP